MTPQPPPTKIQLSNTADYREHYSNSVQVRVSLWDFFLLFGTINQNAVIVCHFFGDVRRERIFQPFDAAFVTWSL